MNFNDQCCFQLTDKLIYLSFMKWWRPGFANAYSLEVLIQTSREILLLPVFGTLCSCARAVSWTAQTRITSAAGSVACVLFTKLCRNDLLW